MRQYYVYILASKKNGTLYIGVTNNLLRRAHEHKNCLFGGFTQKYRVYNLVFYETFSNIREAIAAEKQMKKWKRQWKIQLIEQSNPQWRDLYCDEINRMDSRFRGNDIVENRISRVTCATQQDAGARDEK